MIPSGDRVHMPVTSPTSSAFPISIQLGRLSPNLSAKRLHAGLVSRSSLFLTFRPPVLLATQVSPAAAPFKARRTAVTFTPEQIMHRYLCMHRVC
jgi:hypothetical protein